MPRVCGAEGQTPPWAIGRREYEGGKARSVQGCVIQSGGWRAFLDEVSQDLEELRGVGEHGDDLHGLVGSRAAQWVLTEAGLSVPPDGILVTNGCSEAVYLALKAICKPGDVVAVESPACFSFFEVLRELGLKSLEIPPHPREGLNLDAPRFAMSERLKPAANLAGATFTQATAAWFLEEASYSRHVQRLRSLNASRVNAMPDLIAETFPAGTRISLVPGGMLVWVELPAGSDADVLFEAALKEDILFAPGSTFTATRGFQGYLRLNGSLTGPAAERAVRRIGALAAAL